ncbi:MAG: hypothetical protein ABIG39_01440, partial [Candidatus Micrarchaeota archaeon]
MSEEHKVDYEIFKKDGLNFTPNMSNYDETYKNFKWEDYHSEIGWKQGEHLNAAYVAVDRHAAGPNADKVALIYIDADGKEEKYTYKQLSTLSNKFANVL